jgi:hypothetical protein
MPFPLGHALKAVRSDVAARIVSVPLCFLANALELSLKTGEIFVGKFFQIDEFISSPFSA